MLTPEQKLSYLRKLKANLEEKIYDAGMEIRMWERRKITAGDQQLLGIETVVKGIKGDKSILIEKLDIVDGEILDNEKLIPKK